MADDSFKEPKDYPAYIPDSDDIDAIKEVLETQEKGRAVIKKGYAYFGGNNLEEAIDDWTKRWNGYIPPMNPLLDQTQSAIFINFTRNAIISYLSKVAMSPVKSHIIAVNKKSGLPDQKFADILEDLNTFSLNAENGNQKFLQAALECVTKGTIVVYEGYMKNEQKVKSPLQFDAATGKIKYKEEKRVIFDNCFQEVVPLEDFYITNAFQSDIQKQPKIIWRKITSHSEGAAEFSQYKNWKFVRPGGYVTSNETTTFYRVMLLTELGKDQIEILRYYCRYENKHIVMINGVIMYDGPIPFKDGKYPFAKSVNEPFAVDFFWGSGHPGKYMGEQDLINTFINAMADKTVNSTQFTGLSSDLDDLIEDDTIEIGKWRKVGDIEKWKYLESPPVNAGEMNMFQNILQLARESGNTDAGNAATARGGKLQTKQVMIKQQEMQQKLSFNMNFLEDMERDRTELRISHILQFYSIPKIEKITGKKGKEIEKLTYREIQLTDTKLSDGRKGTKIIKLITDEHKNPDSRAKLADDLSMIETMGDMGGTPTEALAISIDTFNDFNNMVQVVKNSSYERNQALDQASRMEFANWRLQVSQLVPLKNPQGLIEYVEAAFDIDTDQFETAPPSPPGGAMSGQGQPQVQPTAGGSGKPQGLAQNAPSSLGSSMAQLM